MKHHLDPKIQWFFAKSLFYLLSPEKFINICTKELAYLEDLMRSVEKHREPVFISPEHIRKIAISPINTVIEKEKTRIKKRVDVLTSRLERAYKNIDDGIRSSYNYSFDYLLMQNTYTVVDPIMGANELYWYDDPYGNGRHELDIPADRNRILTICSGLPAVEKDDATNEVTKLTIDVVNPHDSNNWLICELHMDSIIELNGLHFVM